jgi:uncharacterized protein YlxW (UPF0749 family)
MKRSVWILWTVVCVLGLAVLAGAQAAQEKKMNSVQSSAQNQSCYQKMVQSEALTQQMAQNRYTYEKTIQKKTASRKMAQTQGAEGSGSNGKGEGQGQGGNRSRGGSAGKG